MESTDLLIVGAGPAGMAAAIEARGFGLSVIVADENSEPGGQVYRRVLANAAGRSARGCWARTTAPDDR